MKLKIDCKPEDIVDGISEDDAMALIVAAELAVADCDFTLKVAKHFVAALIKEYAFSGEPFDIAELLPIASAT